MILSKEKIFYRYYAVVLSRHKSYSHTISLPKTAFPLKLQGQKLKERDKSMNELINGEKFYCWQRKHLSNPEFVLHDGPPYANGAPHMGHAINKVLKDTILRYKVINGTKVHYVPGWDCHGLPIELKACSNSIDLSPNELRNKARNFASETIQNQMEAFKSWGVMGDWTNAYRTYTVPYVKNQFNRFYKLYECGYVYRDFKPIYWSPSSRTALAEAELVYKEDHVSPSAYVRLRVKDIAVDSLKDKIVYSLVWTTTPWTLPSNQAVCYNEELSYVFVRKPQEKIIYIVAAELVENLSKELNVNLEILGIFSGSLLNGATYIHPVYSDKILPFLPASHVSATKGTGLVHTAPAHGPDDFLVALNNKLSIVDMINEKGCYKNEVGKDLAGKFVLTEGNETVLQMIKDNVVHLDTITHSYPYDWRTKMPVIIRASQQWFIDTNKIKHRAIELLKDVQIIPQSSSEIYKRNMIGQLEKRPYWCISRQRKWGVPIPVLFDVKNNNTIINNETMNHYNDLLDKFGTDFWWKLSTNQLIPESIKTSCGADIEKSQDILDIWFDSGISWSYVLGDDKVADMYLEGVDQFTGWFQSSLLTSVALRDKSPYKTIYVHGFAVDENGVKMSKSLGNVIDPDALINGVAGKKLYGLDVLRWWVVCHASQDSLANVSNNVLESCVNEVQKVRSVLRFALGALSDYKPTNIQYNNLLMVDKYMLHLLSVFYHEVQCAVHDFQFHKIRTLVLNFLSNPVSALFYTSIKDRLYCDLPDSPTREAAQFVLLQIFWIVAQSIAPIVPHLAEELYLHLPHKPVEMLFMSTKLKPDAVWLNADVEKVMDVVLDVRRDLNKDGGAKLAYSAVKLGLSSTVLSKFKEIIAASQLEQELVDILQVSEVFISDLENLSEKNYHLDVCKSVKHLCDRCRKVQSTVDGELCNRCVEAVKCFENKQFSVS